MSSYYSYVPVDMYVSIQNKSAPSVEESSATASVTHGVYVNGVSDTGHYDVPRRMGSRQKQGVEAIGVAMWIKKDTIYNVVELKNEALPNQ